MIESNLVEKLWSQFIISKDVNMKMISTEQSS